MPEHPVDRYNLRVARVEDAVGDVVGYALVERQVYWEHTAGAVWWRRFSNPETCAVINVELHGDWQERFLPQKELDAAILDWDRDRWVEESADGARLEYSLTWLSHSESAVVAQAELGADVEWLRRVHRHPPNED